MIYIYLLNLINFIISIFLIKKYLHIYQLKDYKILRFLRFFKKKWYFYIIFLLFLIFLLLNYLVFKTNLIVKLILNILLIAINTLFNFNLIKSNKTPIKYTNKMKHLYLISISILFIINISTYGVIASCLCFVFIPSLANFINIYDKIKNHNFIKNARKLARLNNTKIIAITGSNGKTSVKNILFNMLTKKYPTQMTPKSYNTELGISKFINEELSTETKYLILEYGARRVGDIARLCDLFGADYGIVTNIAPQHIESFKSIDNVYLAKKELPNYLKANLCIYNYDNEKTYKMYKEKIGKKIAVSINKKTKIHAENIKIIDGKTNFDLILSGEKYNTTTNLLGRHNVTNILLATALAQQLKIDTNDIISAIENLEPIQHRLQLIRSHINILDDSYNCSIASARESLWVLDKMPNTHVVATPGIIEAGNMQYDINYQLGKMLSIADIVIIIGSTNANAISSGLKSKNFNKKLLNVSNLEQAKSYFKSLKKGDTLLLLNDLPDDYN